MKKVAAILLVTLAGCSVCGWPPLDEEFRVIPLQHISAPEVVKSLPGAEGLEILADSRQNSIVLKGPKREVARVEKRIRELDVP